MGEFPAETYLLPKSDWIIHKARRAHRPSPEVGFGRTPSQNSHLRCIAQKFTDYARNQSFSTQSAQTRHLTLSVCLWVLNLAPVSLTQCDRPRPFGLLGHRRNCRPARSQYEKGDGGHRKHRSAAAVCRSCQRQGGGLETGATDPLTRNLPLQPEQASAMWGSIRRDKGCAGR